MSTATNFINVFFISSYLRANQCIKIVSIPIMDNLQALQQELQIRIFYFCQTNIRWFFFYFFHIQYAGI